ncbi:MAG: DUF885 family protein, partial [bacterium]
MAQDEKASDFSVAIEDFLKEMWKRNPVNATAVGVHDYDKEMGEFSISAIEDKIVWLKKQLTRFERMDSTTLAGAEAEDLRLTTAWIRTQLLFMDEMEMFRISPVIYPELCVYACYLLCVREYAPIEERLSSVVKRLTQVSRVLDEARANLSNPPRIWVELAVETSEGVIKFLKGALASLFAQTPSLRKDFEKVSARAMSAFEEFSRFLREHLLESCSGSYAIGRDRFEFLLK